MAYRFSKDFDPILQEGQTAQLYGAGLPGDGLGVRCLAVGAMPEFDIDFGSLTAKSWDEDNTSSDLIMPTMTLGVFRIKIITDMICRLKNPSSVRFWRSRDANWYLPQYPQNGTGEDQALMWRMSEFMVWEDESYPAFDFYSTLARAQSIVLFTGWRFAVEKLAGGAKGSVPLWVNDWPSTRRK